MQRRLVAREINPDVLINILPPHFGAEKKRACAFFFIIFFLPHLHACECVCVPRADEHTEALIKKKC